MKTKNRLIAWLTTLALTLTIVLPTNVLSAYADEANNSVIAETKKEQSTELVVKQ